MTDLKLAEMSLDELKRLQKDVAKTIETFEQRKIAAARAELEAKAKELGVSLSDVLGQPTKGKRAVVAPKYQHPENPSLTWTGRGRKPKWFVELIESGVSAEDLEIA